MGGNLKLSIRGDSEVARAFKELAENLSGKELERAAMFAVEPMANEVRRMARVVGDSGALANSIIVKQVVYQKGQLIYTIIGPDVDYTQQVTRTSLMPDGQMFKRSEEARPSNYAHLVEFGTAAHALSRKPNPGQHPGARAHPFMRPAFEQALAAGRFETGNQISSSFT